MSGCRWGVNPLGTAGSAGQIRIACRGFTGRRRHPLPVPVARTRIMRRANAALEAERNRIARDLHDGPAQGVSAASLSLVWARSIAGSDQHLVKEPTEPGRTGKL